MNVIYVQNILQILKIFKQLWSSIQHDQQGFEYTKWIIRFRKSKNRQHNGQKEKGQQTHKTKDRVTRTPL